MSKRVLLTGATGFVGSRVYPALVAKGLDVICSSRDPERARFCGVAACQRANFVRG